jgi:ATP-dependent protease Clp ATPase subunit
METEIKGQEELVTQLAKIFNIFKSSECEIRPHFFLTGESGSGKSFTISNLCQSLDLPYIEINAAQLTKEGTSGNSLSKALGPLANTGGKPTVCFVDEFDKLFISGNCNSDLAHESTNGVQNEFLKVLESNETSVYGDFGKYINIPINNILFVFAGAFNGEADIDIDRLRELGLKTEFLGRVGLVYNTNKLTLETLYGILDNSKLLKNYLELMDGSDKEKSIYEIKAKIKENFDNNTLGARMINTLIHQYFIDGGFKESNDKKVTFQKKVSFNN